MKNLILAYFFVILCNSVLAQTDSLFTVTDDILLVQIIEITETSVKFIYKGEEAIDYLPKNSVKRIRFRSGRTKNFIQTIVLKEVKSAKDWENVTISTADGEVAAMIKLEMVSAKAKGTTTFSSINQVKERAFKKLKIFAAMQGGNAILMADQATAGNKYGNEVTIGSTTETILTGNTYTNKVPNFEDFKKLIAKDQKYNYHERIEMDDNDAFYVSKMKKEPDPISVDINGLYGETPSQQIEILTWQDYVSISEPKADGNQIFIKANFKGEKADMYKVIYFDDKTLILYTKVGNDKLNFILKIVQ